MCLIPLSWMKRKILSDNRPKSRREIYFAYSIGMAQALFQLGLFVPAEEAVMSPVSGIFTHFPSSDENNYGMGRLESECVRLSEIMKQLSDTDMLLMDESFPVPVDLRQAT